MVEVGLLRTWESHTRVLEVTLRGVPTEGVENSSARGPANPEDQGKMLACMEQLSRHYSIPMRLFEAIGRVNTDYIDGDGRLRQAAWHKQRPDGHVVLYRGHDRVLTIRRDHPGWRLTEDAMRSAHESCRRDARDGAPLPRDLQLTDTFLPEMQSADCVAYAGRLLCELMDRCHGDAECASQAIASSSDGGSVRFDAGVRRAGLYAARALEHVGAIARPAAIKRARVHADPSPGHPVSPSSALAPVEDSGNLHERPILSRWTELAWSPDHPSRRF